MKVLVETSARHVHLSQEHLEVLFGKGHELTVKKMLSQPGQFACEEKVEVIGTKGSLKMSVLGPVRNDTQVEVSLTAVSYTHLEYSDSPYMVRLSSYNQLLESVGKEPLHLEKNEVVLYEDPELRDEESIGILEEALKTGVCLQIDGQDYLCLLYTSRCV